MSNIVHDGYIVRLHDDCHDHSEAIECICCDHNICAKQIFSKGIKGFSTTQNLDSSVIASLNSNHHVAKVEPNFIAKKCGQTVPWGLERIGGLSNTISQIGSNLSFSNVHFFVLDSGISVKNPDINVVEALNFIETERSAMDFDGHGTAVAGLIAAKDNSSNFVGVCPGAPIHGYKVLDKSGSGTFAQIIAGLERVIDFKEAHSYLDIVVNMSLGGYVGTTNYTSLDYVVQSMVLNYNIPVVVAAGNNSQYADNYSPAHTNEAITVGAYNPNNELSDFSNLGSKVDILAPGRDLPTLFIKYSSNNWSGTSFASPLVAGAVGLYMARNPGSIASNIGSNIFYISQSIDSSLNPPIIHYDPDTPTVSVYVGTI